MALAIPNLPSSNLSIAKAFYVGRLGFQVFFEETDNGITGIVGLERDGMRINIDAPMSGHGRQVCVSLEVEDIDRLYTEWSAALGLTEQPAIQPWGARTFGFQDPDDNTIFVLEPAGR